MGVLQVGVDIGGTFTDFTIVDVETRHTHHAKRPTVPRQPAAGVVAGLTDVLAEMSRDPAEVTRFAHGQTIALNTILQRRGEELGLVVTEGFRDILELRRLHLGKPVDLFAVRPAPLIPRSRVVEAVERTLANGTDDIPLDVERLVADVARLRAEHGIGHVVVAFLHSHAFPAHETAAKRALTERWPDLLVTCSHEVWLEIREYERTIAAVLNAYVEGRMDSYLDELESRLRELGVTAPCLITKSNGGVTGLDDARGNAIQTVLSGPASGISAVRDVLTNLGIATAVTLDMGGTSTDIAVVRNGEPVTSRDAQVGDFPIVLPSIEVTAIGAGGGSVIRVNESGVLKVGPDSAGAEPGPACYAHGGEQPTLTDAFLLCGYLSGQGLAGGRLPLDTAAASAALAPLAGKLETTTETAAFQAVEVATSSLYRGVSSVLARAGIEPKEAVLVAFGGAGPVQACALATELSVPTVVVPASPGTLCATGAVLARARADFVRTLNADVEALDEAGYREATGTLLERGRKWLADSGFAESADVTFQFSADMRYERQSYEVEVPLPATLRAAPPIALRELFEKTYFQRYGMDSTGEPVVLVSLRLFTTVPPPIRTSDMAEASGAANALGTRPVREPGGMVEARVVTPAGLAGGEQVRGPAVVELPDSTVVVNSGWTVVMDAAGTMILEVEKA